MNLREELFANQDVQYRDFHSRLVPNVDKQLFIGVRVPVLRKIAKKALTENAENLCHYYEEKMIYGFVMGLKKCTLDEHRRDIESFVPLIDNWAVCDCCASSFKFVSGNIDDYYDFLLSFIGRGEFATRFTVVMLMDYYLTDEYIDRVLSLLTHIEDDSYYVMMGIAWALSVAYVKYPDKVLSVIASMTLPPDLQNMTIRKIRESFRIDKNTKQMLMQYKL